MSCSSCKKKTSDKKNSIDIESLDFLNTLQYDDNKDYSKGDEIHINEIYDLFNELNQISLDIDDLSYNLPREIVNNKELIPGTEVRRYINFTNLKNACDLCDNIIDQDRSSNGNIIKDTPCYNLMNLPEEDINYCFDQENINVSNTYWINGVRGKIINPEYLIPNIFRLCQFNDFSCPSMLQKQKFDTKSILFKIQNLNFNRPKLVEPYIMEYLLYAGVVTNSEDVSNSSDSQDYKYSDNEKDHYYMKSKDLCNIMSLLNFNYCSSLNWTLMNIMRYYNNSLLFQLIDLINVCFKANEYYNSGKKLCDYRVRYASTITCITDNDENCTRNVYYSEIPLTFEQLKIIYSTTIESKNILYFVNNKINYNNKDNNRLSIVFYYALKVFQDVILEMKYSMSPYNSIQQNKIYCKKDYMNLKPSSYGNRKEIRIYEQVCTYVCAMKYKCVAYNPKFYKYLCVELRQMSNFSDPKFTGPSMNTIIKDNGLVEYFSNKEIYNGKQFIKVDISKPLSVYGIQDCGIGPLRINNKYEINVSILSSFTNKYKLLYLIWDKNSDNCVSCKSKGCNDNIENFNPVPDINCNCSVTRSGSVDEKAITTRQQLSFEIDNLSSNYCLRILYTKLVENFYVENEYNKEKGYPIFDLANWNKYLEYKFLNTNKNYYMTFHNIFQNTDLIDNIKSDCSFLDTFELPINKEIDSFNLNINSSDYKKNIMGFGIYSDFNSSDIKNDLFYSQFFLKDDQGDPTLNNTTSIGCNFKGTSNVIAAGSLNNDECNNSFYTEYVKKKLFFINVLSYIPTFTITSLSGGNSLIIDKGSTILNQINHSSKEETFTFRTEINPDIYMSNDYNIAKGWFFINTDGKISSENENFEFDYLWYPPLDLQLHTKSTEKILPSTFKEAKKGIDTSDQFTYYEKGNNDRALNMIIQKGMNKYFKIEEPIYIKTYQNVIKRSKSNSMSYFIQEKSIKKVNYSPFVLEYNKLDKDPSVGNEYSFNSGETIKSSNHSDSGINSSGLYFNDNNNGVSNNMFNNKGSIQLDSTTKSLFINNAIYYKADNINLTKDNRISYPQPFSHSILPYTYQIDYLKNLNKSDNSDISTDSTTNAGISTIKPKYNYILPVYKPISREEINISYYPNTINIDIKDSIDVFQLGPKDNNTFKTIYDSDNSTLKAFPNMNVLYSINKGNNSLEKVLQNDLYSWGQFSKTFNDETYSDSNSPHFRYSNQTDDFYKNQFIQYRSKGYRLECIEDVTTEIMNNKTSNINLNNKYDKGHYISVIPGYDDISKTTSQLVMYPLIKINSRIANYNNTSEIENLSIVNGSVNSEVVKASYKSEHFSYHYNRYINIYDKGESKNMKYTYLDTDSFGIYYYDSLKSNYYPYEKGTDDYSVQLESDIQFEKGTEKDPTIIYPKEKYKGNSNTVFFEPIISKGNDKYYFNYYNKFKKEDTMMANNNDSYFFKDYNNNDIKAITEPTIFNLNYNYISFITLAGKNTLGDKGDIQSFNISQNFNSITENISLKSSNEYFGIVPNAKYIVEPNGSLSDYSNIMYTLYKADKYDWKRVKIITGLKATFDNINYDSYISTKLLGRSIIVYTNYDTENYPLLFDRLKSSESVNFLKSYNIEPSYADINTKSQWPMYKLNDVNSSDNCGQNRTDVSSSFVLKIGASNKTSDYDINANNDCFPIPTKNVKADTIGMTYISEEYPLKGIKGYKFGLYDRVYCKEDICTNEPLYFAPVTTRSKSTIITQFDTKENNLYEEHITIKLKGFNTFGGNMSMSSNTMIAGTPIHQRTQYYSNGILKKYSSKGTVYFLDINENIDSNNLDDITLLSIQDRYLIDSACHYSIYNMDAQNILLFSIDSSISLEGTNPVIGDYNGSMIYQFVEDSGLIYPFMSKSNIADNLVKGSSYLNGCSMDFIESNTQLYSLSSIIGNIPDLVTATNNRKGSIFFISNKFNSKNNTSNISNLTENIYMDNLISSSDNILFDQFGYKVKTLYVDILNNAYLMVINRISQISGELQSHAFLLKVNVDKLNTLTNNKINDYCEDFITLKGYVITDANGTVCDGENDNSRIVFYLSVIPTDETKNYEALNTDVFNSKGNTNHIIQYTFDFNNMENKYKNTEKLCKIFNGYTALTDVGKPYKDLYSEVSNSDFIGQEDPCYIFGNKIDVVNANMKIPYKGSNKIYRTNFLLSNKKYKNSDNNIYSTATLYADRVIEELSNKADYFKTNNYGDFYKDIYTKSSGSITNIELFSYPFKGETEYYTTPLENKPQEYNMDYCSNVIFSKDIENIETTNNCILELPKFMAISNIYVKSIDNNGSIINDNNETNIIIYKNTNNFY